MLRTNRQRQTEQHGEQVLLPNAAVVYALMQHVEETFEYLRSEDRLSIPSANVMVALMSVGQLLGLVERDIERLLNFAQKEPSFVLTGMSYSEFVDAVRCLAVLHGHLALEALPALQVPDLSKALYNTYMAYSQALRPHASGAMCRCRHVAGEPPPRLFWETFLRLSRDAGFVQPDGPLPVLTLERIWLGSSSVCDRNLPEHMCFGQFLRSVAVVAGQVKSEVFVPLAALGMAQEVPLLKPVPNTYRLKHYKEVPLNLGGNWSLPHLTFDALAKAVQEGRQYEYSQFLADAQETAARDEALQRQFQGSGALHGTPDGIESPLSGSVGAGNPRVHIVSPRRTGSASSAFRVGSAGGANGRVRPWSAGLTVLSPHPRRPGAGVASTSGSAVSAATSGREAGEGFPSNSATPVNAVTATPAAAAAAAAAGGGGGVNAGQPDATVVNSWLMEEPSAVDLPPHGSSAPGQLLFSLSPNSRALGRSRSALADQSVSHWAWDRDRDKSGGGGHGPAGVNRGMAQPPPSPALPGVEGGGRVCLDSARPRALHNSTSLSASTSPRISLVSVQGQPGPSSPGTGPPSGPMITRMLSRRSVSNMDGHSLTICACCGGGGVVGGGSSTGTAIPRCGSVEAIEYFAGSLREVRQDVEGRLGALEEHGHGVMQLLAQLQAQISTLQQQQQQQQPQQRPPPPPSPPPTGPEPSLQPDTSTDATSAATSSFIETVDDGEEEEALRDALQRQQQQQQAVTEGPATGPRRPLSPGSRSRSPSRPSSAMGTPEGRIDTARYGVVVRTSDRPGAGTDADVLLTIYGSKGDTGERMLSNGTYNFERGQVSTFVFTAPDVGDVERLRVRMRTQGTAGSAPSWHLDAIQVASSATGTRYRFPHCGWVDNVLGRECILYCKGTAPDADEDPQGWQPTPPRSPPQFNRQQQQSPPPGERRDIPLSPSPTFTPQPVEPGRTSPSPLSSPAELPSPPSEATISPVAPQGFMCRTATSDTPAVHGQLEGSWGGTKSFTAAVAGDMGSAPGEGRGSGANGVPGEGLGSTANSDGFGGGGGTLLQLEERVAELQRRLLQIEGEQADCAMRAAAATAAAVLVRVPAQLLAAVRYGGKGPGGAVGDAHHRSGGGGGAGAGGSGGDSDSALTLLADLLMHLHALSEQGAAAAAAADTQAAAAADVSRRQQSRLSQLQFELAATSQAAEQATKRCEQLSQRLQALTAAPPPPQEAGGKPADSGEVGGGNSGSGGRAEALAEDVRECKARLDSLTSDVKRLGSEQGSGAVKVAVSKVEVVLTETREFQSRLVASLAEVAASLASQRQRREGEGGSAAAVRYTEASGTESGPSLQSAMDALHQELLHLAKVVAVMSASAGAAGAGAGAGARRGRGRSLEEHGRAAGYVGGARGSDDDDDSVPSRSSYG